jgi:small-conductance mechanosensitive channel
MSFFKDIALIGKASETIEGLQIRVGELEGQLNHVQSEHQKSQEENRRLNQQCDELQSQLNHLQGEHQNVSEENELILSQLHQVQEELEDYFLRYQDAKQQLEKTQNYLNKVLLDQPTYFGYESIECKENDERPEQLHWKISNLIAAGRVFENCEFDTFIENWLAGFVFARQGEDVGPLVIWPKEYRDQVQIECIPTGNLDNAEQRAQILKSLSTSDWRLIKVLNEILIDALSKNEIEISDKEKWINGLRRTNDILINHIPNRLRFDDVLLNRVLERPGYEHLSIEIKNLFFDDRIYFDSC